MFIMLKILQKYLDCLKNIPDDWDIFYVNLEYVDKNEKKKFRKEKINYYIIVEKQLKKIILNNWRKY